MTNSLQWKPTPLLLRALLGLLGVGCIGIGGVLLARFPFARPMRVGAVITIAIGVAATIRALRGEPHRR